MSDERTPHAPSDRLEQIVAYLDGELSPQQCAEVERRLSTDEEFRRELQRVDRAWSALDELPRATVDDRFSRTTLELVVAAADREFAEQTQCMPTLRRRRRVSTALLAAAAVAFGFLLVRLSWDDSNEALVADLPVVQQLDVYRQFEDVGFLRKLDQRFGRQLEALAHETPELDQRLADLQLIADPKNRTPWLKSLSDHEKQNLRARYNQFLVLPEREQQRLRQLHAQVVADEQAEQLQRTMLLYRQWLDGQPPGRQFELRTTILVDERLDRIGSQLKSERCDAKFALSDDELRRLELSIRDSVDKLVRRKRWEASWPMHRKMEALAGKEYDRTLREEIETKRDDDDSESDLYQSLVDGLPDRTRETFERIPSRWQAEWVRNWLRTIVSLRGKISQQELERFFAEDLDADTREELLSRPSDEMQDALLKLYMRQPNLDAGEGDGDFDQEDGRRREGPGDPRRGFGPPPGERFQQSEPGEGREEMRGTRGRHD